MDFEQYHPHLIPDTAVDTKMAEGHGADLAQNLIQAPMSGIDLAAGVTAILPALSDLQDANGLSAEDGLVESDPRFIPAFQGGEEWVFMELARRFRIPILQYVRGRIGNIESSEDITQEIFLKIYRFRKSYDPSFRFTSWLWTIARNATSDWRKKEKPRGSQEDLPGAQRQAILPVEEFPCSRPDAERLLLQSGKKRMLRRALSQLTSLQRRVVWLRVIHQLPCEAIANQLGISLSAVKCALYRARIALNSNQPVPV